MISKAISFDVGSRLDGIRLIVILQREHGITDILNSVTHANIRITLAQLGRGDAGGGGKGGGGGGGRGRGRGGGRRGGTATF